MINKMLTHNEWICLGVRTVNNSNHQGKCIKITDAFIHKKKSRNKCKSSVLILKKTAVFSLTKIDLRSLTKSPGGNESWYIN